MSPARASQENDPSEDVVLWRGRWRFTVIFAAAMVLFYPVDRLLLGAWEPRLLGIRLAWALQTLLFVAAWRWKGPRWGQVLAHLNGVILPLWLLLLIHEMGPLRTPYVHLVPSVPLIVMLSHPRHALAALLSGLTCSLGTLALWLPLSPTQALSWAGLTLTSTLFGMYGSAQYRRGQQALSEARQERSRREALEKRALAECQRAQTEKMATVGRLAANVMHEVNNPLAFVRSNLEFLRAEVLEAPPRAGPREELAQVFEETRQGLERIQHIVSDLRGFSRLDEDAPSACALADVVTDAARLAGVRLKNVARLTVDIPPALPCVHATPRRLAQVLLNLLVNAGDALEAARVPHGEVRVTGLVEGPTVALLVEDNGPGFPPEVLPRLFEAFFTTKGPEQGTGLGLNLSRELVERFGGTLRAENRPEGGARLRLELPVSPAPRRA
jgi:signal transduction histidine kinase